jgi:hypothetical protein
MQELYKIPKKKLNHFILYNKYNKEYEEVKYLTQNDLAEGWQQIIPRSNKKNFINHFSITLAHLPRHLWTKLKKNYKKIDNEFTSPFKMIKDGLTRYTIIESNQDYLMLDIYEELEKLYPNIELLQELCEKLDKSQHSSWLVIVAKNYIKHKYIYISEPITELHDFKINLD